MNITSLPPIRKHRTARLLMVAVAALCTLPMLVMGASPASAAATIPVYDLKNRLAPPDYSRVVVDTSHDINQTDISQIDGFSEQTIPNGGAHIYIPQKTGASLILANAGYTVEPDGTHKPIQALYTVNDWYYGVFAYEKNGFHAFADPARDGHATKRTFIDFTVTLMQEGVPLPTSVKGVTGFWDLDGPRDSSTTAPDATGVVEGVELRSGFNGAYVRSDSHLKQFGDNGFGGAADQNDDTVNTVHGNQHYLGATFQGNMLTVRHSNTKTSGYGTAFSPVQTLIAYYLHYDRNAVDATGDTPTMTEPTNDLSVNQTMSGCHVYYPAQANITLATGAKDGDCWDVSQLTRPHHTFMGWSRDKDATEPEATIVMPKHDETVYAVWKPNPHFTYDADKPADYTGTMPAVPDTREIPYDTAASNVSDWKAGDTGLLRGYRFDGWRTARDDASAAYDFAAHVTQDTTVYGSWTPLTINLHYDANGGNGSHDPQNTRWDTTVTIPSDVNKPFSRDGFTLKEWNTKPDGSGTAYQPGGKVPMVDKDVILYAQWAPLVTMMPATGSTTLGWAIGAGTLLLLGAIASAVALMQCRRTRLTPHGHRD